jgi:3-oxoadipate enol-lactonase
LSVPESDARVPARTSALFFREFGDPNDPPIFIVHGLYGESSGVAPLAQAFAARGYRAIAVDALGHGRSPAPEGFTLADQGAALVALIARLGYESAAVVGISMGSYVSAQAAIHEPSRISHLALVVTKGQGATSSVVAYAQRNGFDLAGASMDETIAFLEGALWSPDTSPERRAELLAEQSASVERELTAEDRAAVDRSLADFDLRPWLPSITARTLVVSGRFDGLNPPESGREVAGLIPGARFEVYEHSGHMLASEETDRLVDDVVTLIRG